MISPDVVQYPDAENKSSIRTTSADNYKTIIDSAAGGVTYIGDALPGTLLSAASWRIQRITESGGDSIVEWADSDNKFDNIWNNRAALTYG